MTSEIVLQKTVIDIANSIGIENLTSGVTALISQNSEFFILGIIEKANALSIAFKRNQLRRSDLNDVLQSLKLPPLLGYKEKIPSMQIIPYARDEVLVAFEDRKLDLDSIDTTEMMQYELMPHFDISFLIHEEQDMNYFSPQNKGNENKEQEITTDDETENTESNSKKKVVLSLSDQRDEETAEKKMSRLQNYFQKTIEYVQMDSNRSGVILEHVQRDIGVGKLLHRYIDFFNDILQMEQNNFKKMMRTLKLMTAICANKEYQIEEFIDQILAFAFTFLTTHAIVEQSTSFERIQFKDKVANLLNIICEHCGTQLNDIKSCVGQTLLSIEETSITENDPEIFYGCLKTYSLLGVDFIRMFFIVRIKNIYERIQSFDSDFKDLKSLLMDTFNSILYQLFVEEFNTFKEQQQIFDGLFQEKEEKEKTEDNDLSSIKTTGSVITLDLPLPFLTEEQRQDALSCVSPEFFILLSSIYQNPQSTNEDEFVI